MGSDRMIAKPPSARRLRWLLAWCLAAAVFAAYGASLTSGFINFDDDDYVTGNPHVLGGLSPGGIAWVFVQPNSLE